MLRFDRISCIYKAIADYDAVLVIADARPELRARALLNRGTALGKRGEPDKEIADYDAMLAMPETLAEDRARALVNHGIARGKRGDPDNAITDFDAALAIPQAQAEYRARALVNRGVAWLKRRESEKATADFNAVIAMGDAPADLVSDARNRAELVALAQLIEPDGSPKGTKPRSKARRANQKQYPRPRKAPAKTTGRKRPA